MAKRKPRLVPNYQPLGKLIGAARGEINATQAGGVIVAHEKIGGEL